MNNDKPQFYRWIGESEEAFLMPNRMAGGTAVASLRDIPVQETDVRVEVSLKMADLPGDALVATSDDFKMFVVTGDIWGAIANFFDYRIGEEANRTDNPLDERVATLDDILYTYEELRNCRRDSALFAVYQNQ